MSTSFELAMQRLSPIFDINGIATYPQITTDVFSGINFSTISTDEMQLLWKRALGVISINDMRPWVMDGNSTSGHKRGKCSRNGAGGNVDSRVQASRSDSSTFKCLCPAKVIFYTKLADKGKFKFTSTHNEQCLPTSSEVMAQNSLVWKMLASPSKTIAMVAASSSLISRDPSLTDSNLRKQLFNIPTQKPGAHSTSSSSGDTDAMFLRPPCGVMRSVIATSRSVAQRGENTEQLEDIEILVDECQKLGVTIQINKNAAAFVSSINFHDPVIAPCEDDVNLDVLMADVTYGIVDPRATGFHKMSSISQVTASRKLDLLCASLIKHEDIATFVTQLEFLVSIYPELGSKKLVFFVDGDQAMWGAIRRVLPEAFIVLCLYHSSENMKSRFGPLVRISSKSKKKSTAAPVSLAGEFSSAAKDSPFEVPSMVHDAISETACVPTDEVTAGSVDNQSATSNLAISKKSGESSIEKDINTIPLILNPDLSYWLKCDLCHKLREWVSEAGVDVHVEFPTNFICRDTKGNSCSDPSAHADAIDVESCDKFMHAKGFYLLIHPRTAPTGTIILAVTR
jgi:hypothetical protein